MLARFQRALGGSVLVFFLVVAPECGAGTFQLVKGTTDIPERGAVVSYSILTESNRFSFLPPPSWSVSHNVAERTVTLVARDLSASLSFKIIGADAGPDKPPTAEQLRERVLERFPEGKIVREFPCFTSGQKGLAFDLERLINKKMPLSTRIAFVVFPGGRIEFNLTAATKIFPSCHRTFGNLLTSFQIEPWSVTPPPRK